MEWFDNLPDMIQALILVDIMLIIILVGIVLKRICKWDDKDPYEEEYPE